ncbi:hypothetical protein PMAYCL1PPCAC_31301, partial [Pristionchus mayeri]
CFLCNELAVYTKNFPPPNRAAAQMEWLLRQNKDEFETAALLEKHRKVKDPRWCNRHFFSQSSDLPIDLRSERVRPLTLPTVPLKASRPADIVPPSQFNSSENATMEWARSLRRKSGDFVAMKDELKECMKLTGDSTNQDHRVMYAMSNLLFQAVECMQQRKQFNATQSLTNAFSRIDTCVAQESSRPQMAFLSFSRSFILFMDSLNGFCTISKILEMPERRSDLSPFQMPKPKVKMGAVPLKRARLCPPGPHESGPPSPMPPFIFRPIRSTPSTVAPSVDIKVEEDEDFDGLDKTLSRPTGESIPLFADEIKQEDDESEQLMSELQHQGAGYNAALCDYIKQEDDPRMQWMSEQQKEAANRPAMKNDDANIHRVTAASAHVAKTARKDGTPKVASRNIECSEALKQVANKSISDFNLGKEPKSEFKEEEIVKEEPIEQPVSDKVSFGSYSSLFSPSTSTSTSTCKTPANRIPSPTPSSSPNPSAIADGRMFVRVNKLCPSSMRAIKLYGKGFTRRKLECPVCHCIMPDDTLAKHIKMDHKDSWLRWVITCPENECDYRSVHMASMHNHRREIHGTQFWKWRFDGKPFQLPPNTRCPYCPKLVNSISVFLQHMEAEHVRLCSYEALIIKCAACNFTTARCSSIYQHWHESEECDKGMSFNYAVAKKMRDKDLAKIKEEQELRQENI